MMFSRVTSPRPGGLMKDDSGFTLVELMAVILLMTILVTLGAGALRRYWFVQALSGAQNEVLSQLRAQQEESRTTAPKVFGARFTVASSDWQLIQYDATAPVPCTVTDQRTFGSDVQVASVDFDPGLSGAVLAGCLDGATDLVLFHARGSASPGSLTLVQSAVDRQLSVCVTGLTGRVDSC